MPEDGKVVFKYVADTSGIDAGNAAAESKLKSVGSKLGGVGLGIAKALGVAFVAASTAVYKVGSDFEATMSGVQAVSGATAEQMEVLTAAALQAGEDTVFSASESAKAIEELIKAGLSIEQVLKGGLAGALDLAAAGEISIADSAIIASTALNAFRDDNLTMADAADILAGAANASATDVKGLSLGLAQSAAVAANMGLTFEDTTTALAVFAQNGLKGSDAGTSLKTMLMRLQPTTDKQAKAMQELGLYTEETGSIFYDAQGKIKSLDEIADILAKKLGHLTDAERQMALQTIFGADAIRGATILFREGAAGVDAMNAAMKGTTAAEVAAERMDNLKGALERVLGTLETIGVRIYENIQEPLKEAFDSIDDQLKELADSEALTAFGESLGDAMAILAQAVVDILPVLLELLTSLLPPLMQIVEELLPPLIELIQVLLPPITTIITELLPPVLEIITALLPLLTTLVNDLFPPLVETILPPLVDMLKTLVELLDLVKPLLDPLVSMLQPLSKDILEPIAIGLGLIADALKLVTGLIDGLMKAVGALTGMNGWKEAKNAFGGAFDVFSSKGSSTYKAVQSRVSRQESDINDFFGIAPTSGGGRSFGNNALGTNFWRGGKTWLHEVGPEIVDLPMGTRIYPTETSERMMNASMGNNTNGPSIGVVHVYPDSATYSRLIKMLEKSERSKQDGRAGG